MFTKGIIFTCSEKILPDLSMFGEFDRYVFKLIPNNSLALHVYMLCRMKQSESYVCQPYRCVPIPLLTKDLSIQTSVILVE